MIVSLLDIHVTPPSTDSTPEEPPLELLEAGTGHGSLTLHLARAIHAANSAQPHIPSIVTPTSSPGGSEEAIESSVSTNLEDAQAAWRKSRRAILHTLDINEHHSNHARKVVRGFRKGLYAGNVDFHVGDLSAFVEAEIDRRATGEAFLSYVILDLPSTQDHLRTVAEAMKDDAVLTVFCPSVTQIAECVEHVKKNDLPFFLEQVVELGANYSAGRPWDIRVVKPRAVQRLENEHIEAKQPTSDKIEKEESSTSNLENGTMLQEIKQVVGKVLGSAPMEKTSDWKTVCRPEVGGRITGGGFLGLWRRTKDLKVDAPAVE